MASAKDRWLANYPPQRRSDGTIAVPQMINPGDWITPPVGWEAQTVTGTPDQWNKLLAQAGLPECLGERPIKSTLTNLVTTVQGTTPEEAFATINPELENIQNHIAKVIDRLKACSSCELQQLCSSISLADLLATLLRLLTTDDD